MLTENELAYCCVTSVSVLVCLLAAVSVVKPHCAYLAQSLASFLRPCRARTGHPQERYIEAQILAQKVGYSRKVCWYYCTCFSMISVTILWNIFNRNDRWMTMGGSWTATAALMVSLIQALVGNAWMVDVHYIVAHLLWAFYITPGISDVRNLLVLSLGGFFAVSVPLACVVTSPWLVVLGQLIILANGVYAVALTDFEAATYCSPMASPQTVVFFCLWYFLVALLAHRLSYSLMKQYVESQIRENDSKTQLSAVTSLLELTCDAVLELDAEMKLTSHSRTLAAMLLRLPGSSLQGLTFMDLVAPNEATRAFELLTEQPYAPATAFHTHLVDSSRSKFRTEVFQVRYTKTNGQKCHLLGLRDFTDLKSLANHAKDAIEDQVLVPGFEAQDSDPSYDMCDSQSFCSSFERMAAGSSNSPVILEKRLNISQKESFLYFDVDDQVVIAASAPFGELVGLRVEEVLVADFAVQLCHRLCQDAWSYQKLKGLLPDQIASVQHLPLSLKGKGLVEVSGTMKVVMNTGRRLGVLFMVSGLERKQLSSL